MVCVCVRAGLSLSAELTCEALTQRIAGDKKHMHSSKREPDYHQRQSDAQIYHDVQHVCAENMRAVMCLSTHPLRS